MGRPSTVAIHDDGHMSRQTIEVELPRQLGFRRPFTNPGQEVFQAHDDYRRPTPGHPGVENGQLLRNSDDTDCAPAIQAGGSVANLHEKQATRRRGRTRIGAASGLDRPGDVIDRTPTGADLDQGADDDPDHVSQEAVAFDLDGDAAADSR